MNNNIFGKKREVSTPLRLRIFFVGLIQILYSMFVFLMIFIFVFDSDIDFHNLRLSGSLTTEGRITNITQTNAKRDGKPVFAFDYSFSANDKVYENTSFSTQKPENNEVIVEYFAKSPRNSRIKGMRYQTSRTHVAIMSVFPAILLLILLFQIINDLKNISLMETGEIGYATLTRTEMTNARVNNRSVVWLFYEFEDKNGEKITFSFQTHEQERIVNEPTKMLFYDVNNPKKYVFRDRLGPKIILKEDNTFESPASNQAFLLLILPSIAVFMIFVALLSL